jgi:hypothetical protein
LFLAAVLSVAVACRLGRGGAGCWEGVRALRCREVQGGAGGGGQGRRRRGSGGGMLWWWRRLCRSPVAGRRRGRAGLGRGVHRGDAGR